MVARRATSIVLAIVGALCAVSGIVLAIAERSLFDEQEVERTTSVVVADDRVKQLLAREITDRALTLGEFDDLRPVIQKTTLSILGTDEVERGVTRAVLKTHEQLVDGVDDEVVLDLDSTLGDVVREPLVAFFPSLSDRISTDDDLLRFELFRREDLPGLYDTVDTIRTAAWWVLAFGIVCIVAALAVGPGRFGLFALASGTAVVAMFLVATWIQTASDNAIDGIDDDLSRRVARLATDEYLADLNQVALGVVIFGIVAVIAGIGGSWIRRTLFPSKPRTVSAP